MSSYNNKRDFIKEKEKKPLEQINSQYIRQVLAIAFKKDVSGEFNALTEKASPVDADLVVIEDSAASYAKKKVQLANLPGGGGGEANTGSNVGTDGVGVFDTKVGVDLQFRHVAPASSKITTVLNGKDIDIDLVLDQINHNALLNYAANRHLLVGEIDHNQLLNYLATRHFLQTEINHANLTNVLANQHHTKYTDAEADARADSRITAQCIDGQTIDNAIDALIAIHHLSTSTDHDDRYYTEIEIGQFKLNQWQPPDNNVPMNSKKLTGLAMGSANGDSVRFEDVVRTTGNQVIGDIKTFSLFPITPSSAPTTDYQVANKKYTDDAKKVVLGIGSANKRWINCIYANCDPAGKVQGGQGYTNVNATDMVLVFDVPLPPIIGTHNLVVTAAMIRIWSADANDYLDFLSGYGLIDATHQSADLINDNTNRTASGNYLYDFADITVGGVYSRFSLYLGCVCTDAGQLNIDGIQIEYYYTE